MLLKTLTCRKSAIVNPKPKPQNFKDCYRRGQSQFMASMTFGCLPKNEWNHWDRFLIKRSSISRQGELTWTKRLPTSWPKASSSYLTGGRTSGESWLSCRCAKTSMHSASTSWLGQANLWSSSMARWTSSMPTANTQAGKWPTSVRYQRLSLMLTWRRASSVFNILLAHISFLSYALLLISS